MTGSYHYSAAFVCAFVHAALRPSTTILSNAARCWQRSSLCARSCTQGTHVIIQTHVDSWDMCHILMRADGEPEELFAIVMHSNVIARTRECTTSREAEGTGPRAEAAPLCDVGIVRDLAACCRSLSTDSRELECRAGIDSLLLAALPTGGLGKPPRPSNSLSQS